MPRVLSDLSDAHRQRGVVEWMRLLTITLWRDKEGAAPVSRTLYLSDATRYVSTDTGVREYLPLVLQWGTVGDSLEATNPVAAPASMDPVLSDAMPLDLVGVSVPCFSALIREGANTTNSYDPGGFDVEMHWMPPGGTLGQDEVMIFKGTGRMVDPIDAQRTVTLRCTSLEGARIPLEDAIVGPGVQPCPFQTAPDEEWYGGPGLEDNHLIYAMQYFPVSVEENVPDGSWSFVGGFFGTFPYSVSVDINHTHPPLSPHNAFVRETFLYFERDVGWDTDGVKITVSDQDLTGGWGWEIRQSTVPPSRDTSGRLIDYAGGTQILGYNYPSPGLNGPTAFPPERDGTLLATSASGALQLGLGETLTLPPPQSCGMVVFISTIQDPLAVADPWEPFVTFSVEPDV